MPVSYQTETLSQELKLAYAQSLQEIRRQYPDVDSALKGSDDAEELSVEVYDNLQEVHSRIADLQGEEIAKQVPKQSAVLILRFPQVFKWEKVEYSMLGPVKTQLTQLFWDIKHAQEEKMNIDIERVNPIAEHDDTPLSGYYYIWLMTPRGKMPEILRDETV